MAETLAEPSFKRNVLPPPTSTPATINQVSGRACRLKAALYRMPLGDTVFADADKAPAAIYEFIRSQFGVSVGYTQDEMWDRITRNEWVVPHGPKGCRLRLEAS